MIATNIYHRVVFLSRIGYHESGLNLLASGVLVAASLLCSNNSLVGHPSHAHTEQNDLSMRSPPSGTSAVPLRSLCGPSAVPLTPLVGGPAGRSSAVAPRSPPLVGAQRRSCSGSYFRRMSQVLRAMCLPDLFALRTATHLHTKSDRKQTNPGSPASLPPAPTHSTPAPAPKEGAEKGHAVAMTTTGHPAGCLEN